VFCGVVVAEAVNADTVGNTAREHGGAGSACAEKNERAFMLGKNTYAWGVIVGWFLYIFFENAETFL
jgi:hypothetical protein